jgi:hypothetical protein
MSWSGILINSLIAKQPQQIEEIQSGDLARAARRAEADRDRTLEKLCREVG